MKKGLKIFLIIFLSLLAVVFISAIIINQIIEDKVENFLATRMPENIVPTYKSLNINLLGGTITIDSAAVSIKNKSNNVTHTTIHVDKFIIENVSYWNYLFKEEIDIEDIKIKQPTIVYYKDKLFVSNDSTVKRTKPIKLFKPFLIEELKIYDADLTILDNTKDSIFMYSKNLTMEIRDILLNDSIVSNRLPVHFEKYKASSDSVYMKVGNYETLSIGNINIEDENAVFSEIHLKTKYSRSQLSNIISVERDHFDVEMAKFSIHNIDFGFKDRRLFATSSMIELDNPIASIFRDKLVADDPKIKPLYSKMLRELPIDLTVDSLKIKNASITYTEKVKEENNGGTIEFSSLNAAISNVSNTYLSPVRTEIDIDAIFMNDAPLHVNWDFDVNNATDTFQFKGRLGKLQSDKLNSFTKPNLKIMLEGDTNQTYFTINGDYANSVINMRIKYTDFKVSILNKDGKKKNEVLSVIANLLFSKDSEKKDDIFREGRGHVERDQTKSFFNYLWLNVKEGLLRCITGLPDQIDRDKNSLQRKKERQDNRAQRKAERHERREARRSN